MAVQITRQTHNYTQKRGQRILYSVRKCGFSHQEVSVRLPVDFFQQKLWMRRQYDDIFKGFKKNLFIMIP